MNIVIPMAGLGQRFYEYTDLPKPLIPIPTLNNKTMVECAIESLNLDGHHTFITRKYDNPEHSQELNKVLKSIRPDCSIIEIDFVTDGPACSALLAESVCQPKDDIIITNCDQIMEWDSSRFQSYIDTMKPKGMAGCLVTYNSDKPCNSYAELDENNWRVKRTKEKEVISNHSLNGIHYFYQSRLFFDSVRRMIDKNDRVNGEFYISHTYNHMSQHGCFSTFLYPIDVSQHWAVGRPEDLEIYINAHK